MPATAHAVGPRKPTSSGIGDRSSSNNRPCTPALAAASACASDLDGAVGSVSPVRVTPQPPGDLERSTAVELEHPHDFFQVGRQPGPVSDVGTEPNACRAD